MCGLDAIVHVQERSVEEGIALAEQRHVAAGLEVTRNARGALRKWNARDTVG